MTLLFCFLRSLFIRREALMLENLALRQQLAANPRVERFHRTLREDALNHFIFLNASQVRRVAREFMEYYNRARPSQATHAIPDPYPELLNEPHSSGKPIALPVFGGVQHDYRLAA